MTESELNDLAKTLFSYARKNPEEAIYLVEMTKHLIENELAKDYSKQRLRKGDVVVLLDEYAGRLLCEITSVSREKIMYSSGHLYDNRFDKWNTAPAFDWDYDGIVISPKEHRKECRRFYQTGDYISGGFQRKLYGKEKKLAYSRAILEEL